MKKQFNIIFVLILSVLLSIFLSCERSVESMFLKAERISTDKPEKAIEIYNKIIKLDNKNAEAYFLRGNMKEYQLIMRALNLSSYIYKLDPSYYELEPIISDYDLAIAYSPNPNYKYYFGRARFYTRYGYHTEAINDYYKSIGLNNDLLNKKLDISNDSAFVIAILNYIIDNNIKNNITMTISGEEVNNYGCLGYAYYRINDFDNALKYMSESIKANPNVSATYFIRGDAYWRKEDYQLAINDYRKGRKLNPNFEYTTEEEKYETIDPYDFEVRFRNSSVGNIRLFKSTVTFWFNSGPEYYFKNLRGDTRLVLHSPKRIENLWEGRKATVYFTFNPKGNNLFSDVKMTTLIAIIF